MRVHENTRERMVDLEVCFFVCDDIYIFLKHSGVVPAATSHFEEQGLGVAPFEQKQVVTRLDEEVVFRILPLPPLRVLVELLLHGDRRRLVVVALHRLQELDRGHLQRDGLLLVLQVREDL